ncbi:uncharacterized protein LOC124263053 [Haliotis rubra]|uniref:uncharacterized protein LOC124263053 n=1 Tax=Haliotis rubra TaxID=36100 RepID=UPI001EE61305|nr:uncharacterized protein LOC124263053 [Haliotis rubra]
MKTRHSATYISTRDMAAPTVDSFPPSRQQTLRMDYLNVGLKRRQMSSAACHMRSSSSKVLSWLESNIASIVSPDSDCCLSPATCSNHNTSVLAVLSKILEDRLLRLNTRRRQIEQRDDVLDERRRTVEAMALKVLNSSGETTDMSVVFDSSGSSGISAHKLLTLCRSGATTKSTGKSLKQDQSTPAAVDAPRHVPSSRLQSTRSGPHGCIRPRLERPDATTSTSSNVYTHTTAPPPKDSQLYELKRYYKNGYRCTWC